MTFNVSTLEIAGGRRCWGIVCELKLDTMHILEVKYGPPGAICGRSRPDFSYPYALWSSDYRNERAAELVGHNSFDILRNLLSKIRLNVHLSSVAQSSSFEMPAELVPRATAQSSSGRLSSFGFSGTIAHGAFVYSMSAI